MHAHLETLKRHHFILLTIKYLFYFFFDLRSKLIFVLRNTPGHRVKLWSLSTVKNIFKPSVVYATDRSKAVVPGLFLFCVALWFILRGASCFKIFPCSLSSCFFIPFSSIITPLWEEGAGLCACLFVLYVLGFFLSFFYSSWCRGLAAVCDCGTLWSFLLTFLLDRYCHINATDT